jgi:hypothetical protein
MNIKLEDIVDTMVKRRGSGRVRFQIETRAQWA